MQRVNSFHDDMCIFGIFLQRLPNKPHYPSMTIKVYDRGILGSLSLVGNHVIKSVEPYVVSERRSKRAVSPSRVLCNHLFFY